MRLFDFVDSPDMGDPVTNTKIEAPILIKSEEAPRMLERPASANPLFALVEGDVYIRDITPIEYQRKLDGTPINRNAVSALRPPEPQLYLEGISKGVNEDGVKNDRANPRPDLDPDTIVKAFLDFEG